MTPPDPSAAAPIPHIHDRALGIIATAAFLALLYFARDVLVPITLAFILSLLIAPLVRVLPPPVGDEARPGLAVVETCVEDQPFLVDSIVMAVRAAA